VLALNSEPPAFTLEGVKDDRRRRFSLADYRGRWVIVSFYPADFTFVAPLENP
jgi:alkyl hydroperoxide reductase subunit AhpC